MIQSLKTSLVMLTLFTFLLGAVYPALSTLIIQSFFAIKSQGSLIRDKDGQAIGSSLIGQNFTQPKYFWGRLSATNPVYNAAASSGSNMGVNNPSLDAAVKARIDALQAADPDNKAAIPVDLVTASGSGLDPAISPAAAAYQVGRVARARDMDEAAVKQLVVAHTEGRQWGFLGEPCVNVLELNLALDGR